MKNIVKKLVIPLIIITSLFSFGCAKKAEESVSAGAKEVKPTTRTVTDTKGTTVTIPYEVTKVAAGGALNQVVLMLGGADKLVATAEVVQTGFFPKVYPRIKSVPAAYAGSGGGTLSLETILQTSPQVVFGGTTNEKDAETLKASDIACLGLTLNTPEDIKNTVKLVGEVLGKEAVEKADQFCKYYDNNIKYASDLTKTSQKVRVFVASGDGAKGAVTSIPGNDINTSYISAAGGINIIAEKFPTTPTNGSVSVDFEFLIKEQPEVIIANSKATYDYITDASNGSQWQELTAVKNKKVYLNPKGVYLWSVRSAEGALQPLWLVKTLHPEVTKELDIKQKLKEFYKNYYYYDVTDEDIEAILNPKN
jgi:iron complex transport system substrate-binding protein